MILHVPVETIIKTCMFKTRDILNRVNLKRIDRYSREQIVIDTKQAAESSTHILHSGIEPDLVCVCYALSILRCVLLGRHDTDYKTLYLYQPIMAYSLYKIEYMHNSYTDAPVEATMSATD